MEQFSFYALLEDQKLKLVTTLIGLTLLCATTAASNEIEENEPKETVECEHRGIDYRPVNENPIIRVCEISDIGNTLFTPSYQRRFFAEILTVFSKDTEPLYSRIIVGRKAADGTVQTQIELDLTQVENTQLPQGSEDGASLCSWISNQRAPYAPFNLDEKACVLGNRAGRVFVFVSVGSPGGQQTQFGVAEYDGSKIQNVSLTGFPEN